MLDMKKITPFLALILLLACTSPLSGKEYAIIRDTLFGSQRIEFYQSLEDALKNFKGEGKLYELSRKEVSVRRVETKKKIEVTEYQWIINEGEKKQ